MPTMIGRLLVTSALLLAGAGYVAHAMEEERVPTRDSTPGFRGTTYRGVRTRSSPTDGRNVVVPDPTEGRKVDDGTGSPLESTSVPKRPP